MPRASVHDIVGSKEYFLSRSIPEPNSGCWLWLGATAHGYGEVKYLGSYERAHRLAYEAFKGHIKPGNVVHHKCGVRSCVNPDHLKQCSQKENLSYAKYDGTFDYCKNGHKKSRENVYISENDGLKKCRRCLQDLLGVYVPPRNQSYV